MVMWLKSWCIWQTDVLESKETTNLITFELFGNISLFQKSSILNPITVLLPEYSSPPLYYVTLRSFIGPLATTTTSVTLRVVIILCLQYQPITKP